MARSYRAGIVGAGGVAGMGLLGDGRSVNARFRVELMRNSTHLLDTLVYALDARAERVAGYVTGENGAVDALGAGGQVDGAGAWVDLPFARLLRDVPSPRGCTRAGAAGRLTRPARRGR